VANVFSLSKSVGWILDIIKR